MKQKMLVPFASPFTNEGEARAAYDAVLRRNLRYGPQLKVFGNMVSKYVGVKYAIPVSSGTAALHAALLSIGIGPGSEVLVPSFSCAPPLIATLSVGAKPVFIDIERKTLNIDPDEVKKNITSKTKVIIPIHYAGHPAEMDALLEIAEEKSIHVIEDVAEALGAEYKGKKAGSLGYISILSFSPNKTITTGEGGMILSNDKEVYEKAKVVVDYGQKGRFNYVALGYNYHMTAVQAAIGIVQMRKINKILDRKRTIAKLYDQYFASISCVEVPSVNPSCKHAYMSYFIIFNSKKVRNKVLRYLNLRGIETRIYFPPLHLNSFYSKFTGKNKLNNTQYVSDRILNIPLSPSLSDSQIEYVASSIKEALSNNV